MAAHLWLGRSLPPSVLRRFICAVWRATHVARATRGSRNSLGRDSQDRCARDNRSLHKRLPVIGPPQPYVGCIALVSLLFNTVASAQSVGLGHGFAAAGVFGISDDSAER